MQQVFAYSYHISHKRRGVYKIIKNSGSKISNCSQLLILCTEFWHVRGLEEKEAEEDKGRDEWTMLEKIQKKGAQGLQLSTAYRKPRIEKFGEIW